MRRSVRGAHIANDGRCRLRLGYRWFRGEHEAPGPRLGHLKVLVRRGADDGSELGTFHDLFQPQREDNLSERLAEFSPAATDAGIIYVT